MVGLFKVRAVALFALFVSTVLANIGAITKIDNDVVVYRFDLEKKSLVATAVANLQIENQFVTEPFLLKNKDIIVVGKNSFARVLLQDGTDIELGSKSRLKINDYSRGKYQLSSGAFFVSTGELEAYSFKTRAGAFFLAEGKVLGAFLPSKDVIVSKSGRLEVASADAKVTLKKNEATELLYAEAPKEPFSYKTGTIAFENIRLQYPKEIVDISLETSTDAIYQY